MNIDFPQLLILFLVLLFSLTVHESAHAWAADRLGDPTARFLGRISLNPAVHVDPLGTIVLPVLAFATGAPIIGWAKPVPVDSRNLAHPRRDFLYIAAAGPASNVALAVMASAALRLMPAVPVGMGEVNVMAPLARLAVEALRLNILLAVFNMIPIPPLDGGNVLAGLLPPRMADTYDAVVRPYGFLLLYALMLTGALTYLILPPYVALLWLLRP